MANDRFADLRAALDIPDEDELVLVAEDPAPPWPWANGVEVAEVFDDPITPINAVIAALKAAGVPEATRCAYHIHEHGSLRVWCGGGFAHLWAACDEHAPTLKIRRIEPT